MPNGWQNSPAFLYIHTEDLEDKQIGAKDDTESPNPLDETRIHPDDYKYAYEICENILEKDLEESQNVNQALYVLEFLDFDISERRSKIHQLDLGAFDLQVLDRDRQYKTNIIRMIARELEDPFRDSRPAFLLPSAMETMTMLTGETPETLAFGKVVTAYITSTRKDKATIKLESNILGEISYERLATPDQIAEGMRTDSIVRKGQTVKGVIIRLDEARLQVEMSILREDVTRGLQTNSAGPVDPYFDAEAEAHDLTEYAKRKRLEEGPKLRIINHPAWKVWSRVEAERHLAGQNRGDAVIRPSANGDDHLAVTWKVDEGIYHHIGE